MQVGNIPVKLILVLTDCSEFYNKFRPQSYRGASGAVIFFDKSDRQSFDNVPQWLEEFRKFIPSVTSPTYKIPKQLIDPPNVDKPVGLAGISIKPSMHRNPEIVVPLEEAQSLADQLSLPYYDSPFPASRKKFKHFLISLAHQVIE